MQAKLMSALTATLLSTVAGSALAAAPADCFNGQGFGSLNITVAAPQNGLVHVRLDGWSAQKAATDLGVAAGLPVYAIELDLKADWCVISKQHAAVLHCEVPDWNWPRPTVTATFLDGIPNGPAGKPQGTAELSVFRLTLEQTTRLSAGTDKDVAQIFHELAVDAISEADNAARAALSARYLPSDCR